MKVTLIPGRELSADLIRVWGELQRSNADLVSPFFHPEFTQIIAAVRRGVEIAVVESADRIVAFFPFERGPRSVGRPVGGVISDYHGLICAQDYFCDPCELLRQCGLVAWDFDHLIAVQNMFAPFHRHTEPSPIIDLSAGFGAYAASCRGARAERIKLRRLERALGPVTLVTVSTDHALLRRVLQWKSSQYHQTSNQDLFLIEWIRSAIDLIHTTQTPAFSGILSLLYAGDMPVAGHFGMRSRDVWHYWFPAYDPEYSRHSPGLVLLLKMAECANTFGLRRIDLGKGKMLYKHRFANANVFLAEGSVELPSLLQIRRKLRRDLRGLVLNSPLGAPSRLMFRSLRHLGSGMSWKS
jgi:CelD/BcsL family acetyltransferase involved in cellulose biosynthesis